MWLGKVCRRPGAMKQGPKLVHVIGHIEFKNGGCLRYCVKHLQVLYKRECKAATGSPPFGPLHHSQLQDAGPPALRQQVALLQCETVHSGTPSAPIALSQHHKLQQQSCMMQFYPAVPAVLVAAVCADQSVTMAHTQHSCSARSLSAR